MPKNRSYASASDEEIAQQIVSNKDTTLFEVLYDRYAQKIYAKCWGFTKEKQAAEDLAHDILLKTYLKLPEFKGEARFSTWLYSVTYHFCVDYSRKSNRQKSEEIEESKLDNLYESAEDDDEALMEIRVEQLQKLLEKIAPEDKAMLLMKYQDDMSIEEIMHSMGMKESTVKMRLKRAKEKIIKMASDK